MSASVGSEGADPNLTPLLDLVLQLIMFFMITVNFVRTDQFDDAIKLPVATSAMPACREVSSSSRWTRSISNCIFFRSSIWVSRERVRCSSSATVL